MAMEEESWAEELDALRAAPEYHTLIMENDLVRVLEARVPPGHKVPLHTHRWPCVLLIKSSSHFVRRNEDGSVVADSRLGTLPGAEVAWSGPLGPHTLENVGDCDLWVIAVEQKAGSESLRR